MTDTGHRRRRAAGIRSRLAAPLGLATAVALGMSLAVPQPAMADVIAEEAFDQATLKNPNDWYSNNEGPDDPTGWACLTAAAKPEGALQACKGTKGRPIDKPGDGSLRLTDAQTWQNGFILAKKAFPSGAGLRFTIGVSSYGSKTVETPADGISLFLLDGSKPMPTKPGTYGGGLGYTNIAGGYLGIGLDEYGNFSTNAFGAGGTKERNPNSVAVRGASEVGNPLVDVNKLPKGQRISVPESQNWKDAERTVRIDLSPAGTMKVDIDFKDKKGFVNVVKPFHLLDVKGQPPVPKTLRIGIAASTGTKTNIHEVFNGKLETLEPKLSTKVTPEGPVTAGKEATFKMVTHNDKLAGPTHKEVVTEQVFPEGVTPVSASGDGWKCTVEGQKVTCKRPGTGADALQPDKDYPPVTVKTKVDPKADGPKTVTSKVETPGGENQPPTQNKFEVTPAKGPQIVVKTSPTGPVEAGKGAGYRIDVSNKPEAGPTDDEVVVKRTFDKGIVPISAVGDGWGCKIDGQTVTCKRPGTGADVLNPGKSYPPINIGTKVDEKATGDKGGTTEVTTGDKKTGPVKDSTKVKPAPVKDPNVSVQVKPKGDVISGKPAEFEIKVGNDKDAGPTRGPIKVERTFPDGIVPKAADGDGWKCSISGQKVTCTRNDVLQPGKEFPPINVKTAVDKNTVGPKDGTTSVSTEGDPDSGAKVTDTVIVKKDPNQDISCGGWIAVPGASGSDKCKR